MSLKKIHTIRELFGYILENYRWKLLTLTSLSLLGGIFEGIGINAFVPLFSFLEGENASLPDNKIFTFVQEIFSFFHWNFSLHTLFIFILILFFVRAVVLFVVEYVRVKLILEHEDVTRKSLYSSYLQSNWAYLLKQKLGYFETVVMTDVQQSSSFLSAITKTLTLGASLIVYLFIVINISVPVTFATLIGGSIIFISFKPLIRKSRHISTRGAQMKKDIAHAINQTDVGMKALKAMSVEKELSERTSKFFSEFKSIRLRIKIFKHISSIFIQPISLIFIAGIFFIFYRSPNYHFASFLVILYIIQKIFMYVEQLQGNIHEVNETYPFLQSILSTQKQLSQYKEERYGDNNFIFNKYLRFSEVFFSYNTKQNVHTLSDIDLNIEKGSFVGIVGPSGSGKTTIVDLLLRFFQPVQGQILLDNISIHSIKLEEWRRHIGYVSQEIFLLNDTIAENIRFYDLSVKEEQIRKAVSMAHLDEFVKSLPNGLNTPVGERGVQLSGGQRQRIAIARALARQPEILIFDEATSSLDLESESEITGVIENLKGKVTVIAVAHRLSTIINADNVVVLQNGKVVEQGKPQELLKKTESFFYKMYNI